MAARQEQDRKAAIGAIAAVLRERDANAIELEAAIARVAELFVKISSIRVDKLWSFERWSFEPPYRDWGNYVWKPSSLAGAVVAQLQREARARDCGDFSPLPTSTYGLGPVAETAAKHTKRLLAELAKVALPKPVFEQECEPDEPEPEVDEAAA